MARRKPVAAADRIPDLTPAGHAALTPQPVIVSAEQQIGAIKQGWAAVREQERAIDQTRKRLHAQRVELDRRKAALTDAIAGQGALWPRQDVP